MAATERVTDAKTVATERVTEAKAAAGELIAIAKPRLRGVSHEWAFFISLIAGGALIAAAPSGHARVAMAIYAFSLSGLLGTSALYHRVDWRRPEIRKWMRRLDHSMIFLLIAGTVTPFALLVMSGPLADALLIAVWAGALAGIVVELIWVDAPKWVSTIVYLAVGWIGLLGFPGDHRRRRNRRGRPDRRRRGALHRPAQSSTPDSGRTRTRRCSATTRSSTCSSSPPPPRTSRRSRSTPCPRAEPSGRASAVLDALLGEGGELRFGDHHAVERSVDGVEHVLR